MGEETLADKAREFLPTVKRDKTKFPYFLKQWESFRHNLYNILQLQKDGKITANKARELVWLHYEPLKYHPGTSERYINPEQEKQFMVAIDTIAEENAVDPAEATRRYVQQMDEEREYRQAEKRRSILGGLAALGAFTVAAVGYELVERNIISGHVMNAIVFGIPGTMLLAHGVKKIDVKNTMRMGGLAAVVGLLGFMSGNLPNDQKDLMYPHRVLEMNEHHNGHILFSGDAPLYKSR